jgi:hypothetical protein
VSYAIGAGSASGLSNLANLSTGSSTTSFTATGVPAGTYYVRVASESSVGVSPTSNEVVVSVANPSCSGPPAAPSALSATVAGATVVLVWSAASGAPTSYVLEAGSTSGNSDLLASDLGSLATSLTATAAPGSYYVRVRAKNLCGAGLPSNEIVVTVGLSVPPNGPIVLTGTQSMVISGADLVFKNDIILRDNAVLTIQNSTFTHISDFSGQYSLQAFGHSKVIIQNSAVKATNPWISWQFFDDATLQMTAVRNGIPAIWHSFQQRARATATDVFGFHGTISDNASLDVNQATETFIETVFPPNATVNESYPSSVDSASYIFPNSGEQGAFPSLSLRNVGSAIWGITYVPGDNVTIRNMRSLVVTFRIDSTFSGLSAQFSDLRATLYADQTWATGGATLHLIDTLTLPWSPLVSGNNFLTITNSELADFANSFGNPTVSISDSTMSFVRGNDRERITISRSSISGDVVAAGNSVISLIGTRVSGQIIRLENGQVFITP